VLGERLRSRWDGASLARFLSHGLRGLNPCNPRLKNLETSHLQTQPAVDRNHLPCNVIVRLEKKENRASNILGIAESRNDSPFEERVIFSALNALLGHTGVIHARSHDIHPNLPFLR